MVERPKNHWCQFNGDCFLKKCWNLQCFLQNHWYFQCSLQTTYNIVFDIMVVLITLSFLSCKHAFHCKLNLRTFYCIGFSKPKNCVTIVQLQGRITASVSMQMKVTYTAQPSSCSSLQLIFLFCELTHIHKRPCLYKGLFINDVIIFRGVSPPIFADP